MIRRTTALALSAIMLTAPLAPLAAQITTGRLGTLPQGKYACSTPGDAGGDAWSALPELDFTIDNGSTYSNANGSGVYLLTGENLVFTRGPMRGLQFLRIGNATLREIEPDGKLGRVRCIRSGGAG